MKQPGALARLNRYARKKHGHGIGISLSIIGSWVFLSEGASEKNRQRPVDIKKAGVIVPEHWTLTLGIQIPRRLAEDLSVNRVDRDAAKSNGCSVKVN